MLRERNVVFPVHQRSKVTGFTPISVAMRSRSPGWWRMPLSRLRQEAGADTLILLLFKTSQEEIHPDRSR
jgi:hypothetical protein